MYSLKFVNECIILYWGFFLELQIILLDSLFPILLNEKISKVACLILHGFSESLMGPGIDD